MRYAAEGLVHTSVGNATLPKLSNGTLAFLTMYVCGMSRRRPKYHSHKLHDSINARLLTRSRKNAKCSAAGSGEKSRILCPRATKPAIKPSLCHVGGAHDTWCINGSRQKGRQCQVCCPLHDREHTPKSPLVTAKYH
jgi:hypothetical protein